MTLEARLRQRMWITANVGLEEVTLDTGTTVHTLHGSQMGGRIGYNRKHRGKPSYQPILTFIAETREFAGGQLHNGDRPSGGDIAKHLAQVAGNLPAGIRSKRARADSGL